MAWMAASSASSLSAVHCASRSNTLVAMLAAAALVKVRQRILAGGVPPSKRRIARCASTEVLPEPALAETQAESEGSEASRWRSSTSPGISGGVVIAGLRFVAGTARGRPFLHPRQVVVVAVGAPLKHGPLARPIGRGLILEFPRQLAELLQRAVGFCVRRRIFELGPILLPTRVPAAERQRVPTGNSGARANL